MVYLGSGGTSQVALKVSERTFHHEPPGSPIALGNVRKLVFEDSKDILVSGVLNSGTRVLGFYSHQSLRESVTQRPLS